MLALHRPASCVSARVWVGGQAGHAARFPVLGARELSPWGCSEVVPHAAPSTRLRSPGHSCNTRLHSMPHRPSAQGRRAPAHLSGTAWGRGGMRGAACGVQKGPGWALSTRGLHAWQVLSVPSQALGRVLLAACDCWGLRRALAVATGSTCLRLHMAPPLFLLLHLGFSRGHQSLGEGPP